MPLPNSQRRGDNPLPTGVAELDARLDGGPRPGTLAALQAPPESQTGPLLYSLMYQRPTTYVTTVRGADDVRDELDRALGDCQYTVREAGTRRPIRSVKRAIEADAADGQQYRNVVIDSVDVLERTGQYDRYVDLLKGIKSHLLETGGLAVLRCTDREPAPDLRAETLAVAGLVLDLDVVADKNTLENRLTVPKVRGQSSVDEVVKLKLGREIRVDTSRNL